MHKTRDHQRPTIAAFAGPLAMAVVFSTFFLLSPSSAQPPLIVSENVFNESGGGWVRISGVSSTYAWWWDLDSIGNQAHGIAFGPENGYLYLTSSGSHELMVFDPGEGTQRQMIRAGHNDQSCQDAIDHWMNLMESDGVKHPHFP